MADEAEEPLLEEEGEGGGPVKSFLEHLEDLRWVIIKSGSAILIGMVICLIGVKYVVLALEKPLNSARTIQLIFAQGTESHTVGFFFGTNQVATFTVPTNRIGQLDLGTNKVVNFELAPVWVGTNQFLAVKPIVDDRSVQAKGVGVKLTFLDPVAPFFSTIKIAFFTGILLAAPFVMYFIGDFVLPALKVKEKKYVLQALAVGSILFMVGVAFCYFVLLPVGLRAAQAYSEWMGVEVMAWRAEVYFGVVVRFMLAMGLGFEMPVVLLALVKIGILDYRKLASMRRYMLVVNLVIAAILTTPDVITQVLMAFPLQILYECAVWIAWYWERRDRKRAEISA